MKLIELGKKALYAQGKATKASLLEIWSKVQKLYFVGFEVFGKPENSLYGIFSALITILLGFWFANIGIIQEVFSSSTIGLLAKFEFLFTMIGTLLRNLATLQTSLIITHLIFWCLLSALWLEAIKIQHERPKLKASFAPTLLATLVVGGTAVLAISLVTPVLTRLGISVFVSDHFSGTLLLIAAILAETYLIRRFSYLIHRSRKLY